MSPRSITHLSRTRPSVPQRRGSLLVQAIPEPTKLAFKAACAIRKVSMRDAIITFMQEFVVRK